jgi:membrane-associated protease RseP (regulator of RpoE activity)
MEEPMRLKAALLAALLIVPTASRVEAGGGPETAPKAKEKKKIVVVSPEKEILVDDDGVFVSGDEDFETFADLGNFEGLPEMDWFEGGGYIGVRPVEMTPDLRVHFGAPKEAGVFVGTVEKDSPAAKAGLQVADIVTAADGEKIGSKRDLVRAIRRKKEGETVKLDLLRDRAPKTLSVTVAEREGGRVRVGDFGPGMRKFKFRHWPVPPVPPVPPVAPVPPGSPNLQDRLNDLERRLDALEERTPKN